MSVDGGQEPRLTARAWGAIQLLAGGAAGAALFTGLQVPAGTLIGAVVGSMVVKVVPAGRASGRHLPAQIRTVGLVLLGCIAGVRLDGGTLQTLAQLAAPLGAAVAVLLLMNAALAAVLIRWSELDPVTAVLACAPGGVSEIAVTAHELGARTAVVLAIHLMRVLTVVLVVLPLLVVVLR